MQFIVDYRDEQILLLIFVKFFMAKTAFVCGKLAIELMQQQN